MHEVLVRNDLGFAVQDLRMWRTEITGVAQIDARELLDNGRFKYAVLHFRTDEEAENFETRLTRAGEKMNGIVAEFGLL